MRRLRHPLTFAAVAAIFLAGCSNNQVAVTAAVGEVFTIGVRQSARITGEDMAIKFNEVVGDSRCPQNVTCIWEGEASSRITINYRGADYSMVLTQRGTAQQTKESFVQYTFTYGLNPYPRQGEEISPKDYRLTLMVTK